ncbi:MAG: M12 family metallo-peptidase [Polyangiaceae bacterium]
MRVLHRLSFVFCAVAALHCGDDSPSTGGAGGLASGGAAGSPNGTGATGGGTVGGAGGSVGGGGAGGSVVTTGGGGAGGGVVDPWAGPIEALKELDLGEANVGTTIKFPVPNNALGLTTLTTSDEAGAMGIASLRPPAGGSVIFNFEIPGTGLSAFVDEFALNGADPQSDLAAAWPVQEGQWQLKILSDMTPTKAHSRVWVRRTLDGDYHGGLLDFHVFISPGSGTSQAQVTTILNRLFTDYYGPLIGLTLGNVTFATLPASYDNVSSYDEYRTMIASSANAGTAPAVNLFVVGGFSGELSNALGIAAGLPGATTVHGTVRSGLGFTRSGMAGYDASVLAHEIGHLAGLFHTTEFSVAAFDPLGDTPECPNINNVDPQTCPDVSNIMFPIAYGGSVFTALQIRVLRSSSMYRGILDEGLPPSGPLPLPPGPVAAEPPIDAVDATRFELPDEDGVREPATPLERALSAYVCARAGDGDAELWQELVASGAHTEAEVFQVAADPTLFGVPRARALRMLSRFGVDAATRDAALTLAERVLAGDESPRLVRLAALELVDRLSPNLLGDLVAGSVVRADPVVEDRLVELGL